ncbi:hypothetical protein BGZ80_007269, partial [Entomortierella chlamydospora]
MKPVLKAKVSEAIMLMTEGVSTRETAHRLKISKTTATKIRSDNKENMPVNKGGHPRKITAEVVEHIKLNIKRGVLKTATSKARQCYDNSTTSKGSRIDCEKD